MTKKYTVNSANLRLSQKNIYCCCIISILGNSLKILDFKYGIYYGNIKDLSPSSQFKKHPLRRQIEHRYKCIEQALNTKIPGITIIDAFYGKDYGYKNRSIIVKYINSCGHEGISTISILKKHKKTNKCVSCTKIKHGKRNERSSTYTSWIGHKNKLPQNLAISYETFLNTMGENPYKLATIENKQWIDASYNSEKKTLNQQLTHHRKAFKYTKEYNQSIMNIKVSGGYRCPICSNIFLRKDIEVDHIDPIKPLSGEKLPLNEYINRIYKNPVQAICKKCHFHKTLSENSLRASNKRLLKKKLK